MGNLISLDHLIKALNERGVNTDTESFQRAIRIAENPGGCEFCGARTKIAVPVNDKKPEGSHKTACCGKKVF